MTRRLFLAVLAAQAVLACAHKSEAPDPGSREVIEFHAAVQEGDADVLERLIRAKPYLVNAKNDRGESPLKAAMQKGNSDVVDLLRKYGAKE